MGGGTWLRRERGHRHLGVKVLLVPALLRQYPGVVDLRELELKEATGGEILPLDLEKPAVAPGGQLERQGGAGLGRRRAAGEHRSRQAEMLELTGKVEGQPVERLARASGDVLLIGDDHSS